MAFAEVDPQNPLTVRFDGAGADIETRGVLAEGTIILNMLWHEEISANAGDQHLLTSADAWGRIRLRLPPGAGHVRISFAPRWRTGFSVALAAMASGVLLSFVSLRPDGRASSPLISASLDHLILGVSDLARGIAWIEERTGVRPALGGVHPGRGTCNALLSLGPRCYLEILAPDPKQQMLTWFRDLPQLVEPRLVGWMAHPGNLTSLVERLRHSGIAYDGPQESSRVRPDGRTLRWKLLRLASNQEDLLPVLIEWGADSPHPADGAPAGCRLLQFEISNPQPEQVEHGLQILGINLRVAHASRPQLRARIAGPKGTVELISKDDPG
jgi:hypothetical protein